ncbi:hypothetical protein [Streptomyces sp. NPDC058572]|uniref:hypothetical protein n=1 Tax=Streptomyces sp. NPDC058572 TaxID=3346546 RepID=UPI0036627991
MVDHRGTRWGQLILLVALLCGIAAMHTTGHPSAESGHAAHRPAHTGHTSVQPYHARVADVPAVDERAPVSAMDPASVCLAVLGAWGLALLVVRRALSGRVDPSSASWTWLPHTLRANAPPVTGVLARVSVLRI